MVSLFKITTLKVKVKAELYSYLHGVMDGEVLQAARHGQWRYTDFVIE
jgi:hypothetical protein